MKKISYGKQFIDNKDRTAIIKASKQNLITTGESVVKFEKKLSNYLKTKYSLVSNSGTSAIYMAFRGARLKSGDAIIMPSINFMLFTVSKILYD